MTRERRGGEGFARHPQPVDWIVNLPSTLGFGQEGDWRICGGRFQLLHRQALVRLHNADLLSSFHRANRGEGTEAKGPNEHRSIRGTKPKIQKKCLGVFLRGRAPAARASRIAMGALAGAMATGGPCLSCAWRTGKAAS
jgi:hypothetical protein